MRNCQNAIQRYKNTIQQAAKKKLRVKEYEQRITHLYHQNENLSRKATNKRKQKKN